MVRAGFRNDHFGWETAFSAHEMSVVSTLPDFIDQVFLAVTVHFGYFVIFFCTHDKLNAMMGKINFVA